MRLQENQQSEHFIQIFQRQDCRAMEAQRYVAAVRDSDDDFDAFDATELVVSEYVTTVAGTTQQLGQEGSGTFPPSKYLGAALAGPLTTQAFMWPSGQPRSEMNYYNQPLALVRR